MFKITTITCEDQIIYENGAGHVVVTDASQPRFGYAVESSLCGSRIREATLELHEGAAPRCIWSYRGTEQIDLQYHGEALNAYTQYTVVLRVTDEYEESDTACCTFETGRLTDPWKAQWITDGSYRFTEQKSSPRPLQFCKKLEIMQEVTKATIYATAIGMYHLQIDAQEISPQFFAPGFTSYRHTLQYQTIDVTRQLQQGAHEICAIVSGGWAVGSFGFTRKNRITQEKQAFLMELHLTYADGHKERYGTDSSWMVTMDAPVRMADLYDGETFDARLLTQKKTWRLAEPMELSIAPQLIAQSAPSVVGHEEMTPQFLHRIGDEDIYDFGQNFAGIVAFRAEAQEGDRITIRHAEILDREGGLQTAFLRTAKATVTYICTEGQQEYAPHFTYMGFRYIGVKGIDKEKIRLTGIALYSDVAQTGSFRCSDPMLDRLQQNICWGAKSNFVEIPTDCPQRDERMGWTGDIALFAPTAAYNFEMTAFLKKWLRDMRSEQLKTGGIPNTIPSQGYGFPETMPTMAIDFWGDASVLVPWALYRATGKASILRENYDMMKRYVRACKRWAGLFSFGTHRYLWHTPSVLHFGDWVAPDAAQMSTWQKRSKYTATASLFHTADLMTKIAALLGKEADAAYFDKIKQGTAKAYETLLMNPDGTLADEFQTGYVLPLAFGMLPKQKAAKAAKALAQMVRRSDYTVGTGFPGTPFLLFALADHGYVEEAYRLLLSTKCPSWLYEVRMGATTLWERWNGLDEQGECPIGDDGTDRMISYNHYAAGAVGDFLYRRVLGIEPVDAGYRTFRFAPLAGGTLTEAEGSVKTPYGTIRASWKLTDGRYRLKIHIPVGCAALIRLPGEHNETRYESGDYEVNA